MVTRKELVAAPTLLFEERETTISKPVTFPFEATRPVMLLDAIHYEKV